MKILNILDFAVSSSSDPWLSPLQALHMLRKLVDHPSLISTELAKHRLLSVAGAESERRIGTELGQLVCKFLKSNFAKIKWSLII